MSQSRQSLARPRPQRPHVPYHADDLAQGKRTGAAIDNVAQGSDGMEPFDKVLEQADGITPPLLKGRKKAKAANAKAAAAALEDDEYGEVSMDLDESE